MEEILDDKVWFKDYDNRTVRYFVCQICLQYKEISKYMFLVVLNIMLYILCVWKNCYPLNKDPKSNVSFVLF